jgi:hypothetical protein
VSQSLGSTILPPVPREPVHLDVPVEALHSYGRGFPEAKTQTGIGLGSFSYFRCSACMYSRARASNGSERAGAPS